MPKSKSKPKQSDAYTDDNFQILPNLEAIAHFDKKMLGTSYSYLDVLAHEHAVAFTVAKMMDQDLLAETKAAIAAAMENGTDFRDFQKRLKPFMMSKGWWGEQVMGDPIDGEVKKVQLGSTRRLRTIYQTNLHSAYAAGQWDRIQTNKDALPYLQYMPSVAGEPRKEHKKYYGLILPVDHPIWQRILPPNGYGCLCWVKQLTRKQAEKLGISPEPEIETEEVENKRTGKTIEVTKGITPSFDHNHGDRLGALLKIAQDKHGSDFTAQLLPQLDDYMFKLLKPSAVDVVSFVGVKAIPAEIARLSQELSGTPSISEGEIAAQWQQHYDVKLERYDAAKHKVLVAGQPADFAVIDKAKAPKEWQTLDFMFTLDDKTKVNEFLATFKSAKAWNKRKNKILRHIEKADITPLYLGHFDLETRTKVMTFVLSLHKELQQRIVFVTE